MSDQNQSYNDGIEAVRRRLQQYVDDAKDLCDIEDCELCDGVGEISTLDRKTVQCPDCITRGVAEMAQITLDKLCHVTPAPDAHDAAAVLRRTPAKDEATIRADEREQCAQIAEWKGYATVGRQIAAHIRARGSK